MTISALSHIKNRERFLDFAKGICMITITYSHIKGIPFIGKYLFGCHVLVYFFVSGYLAPTNVSAPWLKRRLKGLLIPYVGYGALLILISIIKWNIDGTFRLELLWKAIWGSVYSRAGIFYPYRGGIRQVYPYICYNAGLWFFAMLAWSTIWFTVIVNKCEGSIKKYTYALMALFALCCLCMNLPILLPQSIDTSFCGTILMLFGYLAKKYDFLIKFGGGGVNRKEKILIYSLILPVYFFLTGSNGDPNLSIREYGPAGATSLLSFIVSGACGAVLYCKLGRICEKTLLGKCLACVGRHTVSIIMLQLLLFAIFNPILGKAPILLNHPFLYGTVMVIIVSLLCIGWDTLLAQVRRLLARQLF